jgi:uncharacterized membrane protein YagU involved in acid resistance
MTLPFNAVLYAGLIAGILDITAALIQFGLNGVKPVRLFQGIASGLLGPRTFQGGLSTAALGLALHFFIAITAAFVYYLASRKIDVLKTQPLIYGPLYGAAVYIVMNFIVLPLSAIPKRPFSAEAAAIGLIVLMLCVGLPIALVISGSGQKQAIR